MNRTTLGILATTALVVLASAANAEIYIKPRDLNDVGASWQIQFYADGGAGSKDEEPIFPIINCSYESGLSVVMLAAKGGQAAKNGGLIAEQKEPLELSADIELGTTGAKTFQTERVDWNDNYVAYRLTSDDSKAFYDTFLESMSGGKEIYRFQLTGENGNSSNPIVVYAPAANSLNFKTDSRARILEVLKIACTEFM